MKRLLYLPLLAIFAITSEAQGLKLVDLTSHAWRYQANGVNHGTAWRGTNYDDSSWPSGQGLFGLESNPLVSGMIQTSLPLSAPGGAIATYYFRTHFSYDGSVPNPYLMISNVVDDGAIFYLNGKEFGRVLMPGGTVLSSDLSLVGSEEGLFTILERRATNLIVGDNVLAVEVHQQALNSSDVVFGSAVFVEPQTATTNAGTIDYGFDISLNNYVRASVLLTNGQFLVGGGFSLANSNRPAGGLAKMDRFGNTVPGFAGGTNVSSGSAGTFDVYALCETNGKIYIGGNFNGPQRTNIARLNWDGSLDNTFVPAVPNGRVRAIVPQLDGKFIIAGEFSLVGGVPRGYIARLQADGTLDTAFAPHAAANNRIRAVALLDDGRILIGGLFSTYDGLAQNCLARLDTNGLRDGTFTSTANAEVYCFTKSGSNHYVGGDFTLLGGASALRLARIDASGNVDGSFNVGPGFSGGAVYCVTEQYDGRLIIGGAFTSAAGTTANAYLARYMADGSHDGTFKVSVPVGGLTLTTTLAPSGEVLVGGNFFYQFNRRSSRNLTLLRSDAPPPLTIQKTGGAFSLSWSDLASTFVLEESSAIGGTWTNSSLRAGVLGRRFAVTNNAPDSAQFYRLHSP